MGVVALLSKYTRRMMIGMIITLTTDFGLADPFVGVMKGVILGIAPNARLVDLTHNIPSYDIPAGAFALASAFRYFPAGTVHVAVVDPGVGGRRSPIAVAAHGHILVGPDNGVLSLSAGPPGPEVRAHKITNERWFRHPVSQTFHGRDIFAPAAAHLALGAPMELAGPPLAEIVQLKLAEKATVLGVDKFGNLITSLRPEALAAGFTLRIAGEEIRNLRSSYEEAPAGELFAIVGSAGFVEIAIKQDSAASRLSIQRGAEIEVETGRVNH
jgi:S-adenosylmethionine hydrolase